LNVDDVLVVGELELETVEAAGEGRPGDHGGDAEDDDIDIVKCTDADAGAGIDGTDRGVAVPSDDRVDGHGLHRPGGGGCEGVWQESQYAYGDGQR